MIDINDFCKALSQALPGALVMSRPANENLTIYRGKKMITYPEFTVKGGIVLGEDSSVPTPLPAETEFAESVQAVVRYHNMVSEAMVEANLVPVRAVIFVNRRSASDELRVTVGML